MESVVKKAKKDLFDCITQNNPTADMTKIEKALDVAYEAHSTQFRASGEPYILHPIAVAKILAELKLDSTSITTALLHDTVEDTSIKIEDIQKLFGKDIAKLVDGVTKLDKIEYQPDNLKQAENFRKLLLAISVDIRVLLVKLADRLHNMRTLHYITNPEKRYKLAHETMEIYAPLAERIGIHKFKNELQDIAFSELHPTVRKSIMSRLDFLRKSGVNLIQTIENEILSELQRNEIDAKVSGREKTCCSIWYKMQHKDVTFEQITDIVAFRVIVDDIPNCYKALGAIHSKYHTISDGFKDYISTPKSNGYQSIHTLIMGPEKRCIEIQIRTQHMHDVAELGVAAHWAYKQGLKQITEGTQFRWIRELLEILESTQSPEEFLENTKMEMNYDQIFCFSPKGNLIPLPRGSTPVDFAFAIHSEIGLTCVGAKVNGRIVPLKTQLSNGDQVDIIRSKVPMPSPSWEQFVVTGKARAEIRKFIRGRQISEYVNLGRAMITKSFKQASRQYDDSLLQPVLAPLQRNSVPELLAAIGEGSVSQRAVLDVLNKLEEDAKPKSGFNLLRFSPKKLKESKNESSMPIKGLIPGVALHFAGCCNPIPGDEIVGVVNTGRGVTIHIKDCDILETFAETPERMIAVSWEEASKNMFTSRVKVTLANEIGSLADTTSTIARSKANVVNVKVVGRSLDFFELLIDIEVKDSNHLSSIISSLRTLNVVHSVERVRG